MWISKQVDNLGYSETRLKEASIFRSIIAKFMKNTVLIFFKTLPWNNTYCFPSHFTSISTWPCLTSTRQGNATVPRSCKNEKWGKKLKVLMTPTVWLDFSNWISGFPCFHRSNLHRSSLFMLIGLFMT